jgi:effector-binding domain-containing protein
MGKTILIALAVVLAAAAAFLFIVTRGPDLKPFEKFREPQLVKMDDRKVLALEMTGDPSVNAMKAYSKLFSVYFKFKGASMKVAPLLRMAGSPDMAKKEEWKIVYAVPLPAGAAQLPEQKEEPKAVIADWKYGEVAQILHIGPYSEETPNIQKLQEFIKKSGYKVAGPHEEEYIKGPGMFFKGNPKNYWTLIRYQVKKK